MGFEYQSGRSYCTGDKHSTCDPRKEKQVAESGDRNIEDECQHASACCGMGADFPFEIYDERADTTERDTHEEPGEP